MVFGVRGELNILIAIKITPDKRRLKTDGN